jgi:hypothetical protein
VWSFDHEGEGDLCGFWEIYRGCPVTTAALQQEGGEPGKCSILQKGAFKTETHSLVKTRDTVLLASADWPRLACLGIQHGTNNNHGTRPAVVAPRQRQPSLRQILLLQAGSLRHRVQRVFGTLFCHPLWNIGVVRAPIQAFLQPNGLPEVDWLPEPKRGTFFADPFAAVASGRLAVLFEEFRFSDWRGRISCVEFTGTKPLAPTEAILEMPVHISYPFLLEHDGALYCIPETHEAGEVTLYRAVDFPTRWSRVATLLEGVAARDSTVFPYQGRWWLACTLSAEDANLKLYLWHAPELLGPWQPHVGNPVKTDIGSARPGGTPFVYEGFLYRPAQDCSTGYGARLVINRVLRLTPTEFQEEQAAVVNPPQGDRYPAGIHTLSGWGDITVVDGLRYTFSTMTLKAIAWRYLSRMLAWITGRQPNGPG